MRTFVIVFILTTAAVLAQPKPSFQITHTYTLGGEGGWDYVVPDPPNHRLFIARQNRVMVVSEDGKLLGEVTGINGSHGTAIATDANHGFATEGMGKSVAMFDLKTFKVLNHIPAAPSQLRAELKRPVN